MAKDTRMDFPATKIAHWPGRDTACCDEHAVQIQGVGKVIGYPVSFTAAPEGAQCDNCINSNKVTEEVHSDQ